MNGNDEGHRAFWPDDEPGRGILTAEVVPEPPAAQESERHPPQRRLWLPLGLFIATCLSTLFAGGWQAALGTGWEYGWIAGLQAGLIEGLKYAAPLMTILLCHEMGHFLQARRYGVYASYPIFLPMPISPIGTFGAVIFMEPRMGGRRALFDIGISGPLAGLVPTLIFCMVGLSLSSPTNAAPPSNEPVFGPSILFVKLAHLFVPNALQGRYIDMHPMATAGWVGLLITSINLIPIGQLDGGHVLYALLRRNARPVATLLLLAAIAAVIVYHLWMWGLMLVLLSLMGPMHPPTANDNEPLGWPRIILGCLTLAFIPFGFTPVPFIVGH